jgi:hypothetical protein
MGSDTANLRLNMIDRTRLAKNGLGRPRYEETLAYELDGRLFPGRFSVAKGVVSVNCAYGSRSALVGEHAPDALATILLGEILQSAKVAGDLDAH